jgi:hypothetical protein
MEEGTDAYRVWVGTRTENRSLGCPRRTWEENIKMDLQEVGLGGGGGEDWTDVPQDKNMWWALVNAVMNLRVPQNEGNFLTSLEPADISGMTLSMESVQLDFLFSYDTLPNVKLSSIM